MGHTLVADPLLTPSPFLPSFLSLPGTSNLCSIMPPSTREAPMSFSPGTVWGEGSRKSLAR